MGMIICCSRGLKPAVYDSPGKESRGDDPCYSSNACTEPTVLFAGYSLIPDGLKPVPTRCSHAYGINFISYPSVCDTCNFIVTHTKHHRAKIKIPGRFLTAQKKGRYPGSDPREGILSCLLGQADLV